MPNKLLDSKCDTDSFHNILIIFNNITVFFNYAPSTYYLGSTIFSLSKYALS